MEETIFQQAIRLARAGHKVEARALLQQILSADSSNEMAWLWYADCAPTDEERLLDLETCVRINPSAQRARAGIIALRRKHPVDLGKTQPVFIQDEVRAPVSEALIIPGTGEGELEPTPGPENSEPQASSSLSPEDEWALSAGSDVFTISPDQIPPEEFAALESHTEAVLLTRPAVRPEQVEWKQLERTVSPRVQAARETRTQPRKRKPAGAQSILATVLTALAAMLVFALLVGAALLMRGA